MFMISFLLGQERVIVLYLLVMMHAALPNQFQSSLCVLERYKLTFYFHIYSIRGMMYRVLLDIILLFAVQNKNKTSKYLFTRFIIIYAIGT